MAKGYTKFALQKKMREHATLAETTAGKFVTEARQKDVSLVEGKKFDMLPHQSQLQAVDVAEPPKSISQGKSAEPKLQQNTQEAVEEKIIQNLKEAVQKRGRLPGLGDIILIIIGLGSLAANLVQVSA